MCVCVFEFYISTHIENYHYLIWMSFNPAYPSSHIIFGHKSIVLVRNTFLKN